MRIKRTLAALVLVFSAMLIPSMARAGIFISVNIAPPALPIYTQPVCPGDGYIWTPGYWAWDGNVGDYYWVPGTWIVAPQPGYLWTPGYWGYEGGAYGWHGGYWGLHIGFYGGVNYGFGYGGRGYEGGYWNNNHFFYNRAITNVNVTNVHNVYVHNTTIINNTTINRVSYNGGNGGIQARPAAGELAAQREQHIQATHEQQQHFEVARQNPGQFSRANNGNPPAAALARPANNVQNFHQNAVAAHGAPTVEQARANAQRLNINPQAHPANQNVGNQNRTNVQNGNARTPQQINQQQQQRQINQQQQQHQINQQQQQRQVNQEQQQRQINQQQQQHQLNQERQQQQVNQQHQQQQTNEQRQQQQAPREQQQRPAQERPQQREAAPEHGGEHPRR